MRPGDYQKMTLVYPAARSESIISDSLPSSGVTIRMPRAAVPSFDPAPRPPGRSEGLWSRCLRDVEVCQAECDESGLLCQDCGSCCLTDLRAEAEQKGYRVMIAEGSPTVMKIIGPVT